MKSIKAKIEQRDMAIGQFALHDFLWEDFCLGFYRGNVLALAIRKALSNYV